MEYALDTLEGGDLLLGDANFATYFLLCALRERGIEAVFEQHGSRQRTTDFRHGHRLGARDHLIVLPKPGVKPDWMNQADYDRAPCSLVVRELRTGGKTLVTTLICPKATSKAALKLLYKERWHIELDLRNIKTTLAMELPHPVDGDQGDLGLHARLQSHSPDDGPGCIGQRLLAP